MTKDEVKALCTELGYYIMDEFKSYNLDFGINQPWVGTSRFNYAYLNLYGGKIPEDVVESDKEVLEKFLTSLSNDFLESYDCNIIECNCLFEP